MACVCPDFDQHRPNVPKFRPEFGKLCSLLAKVGRNLTKLARNYSNRADFGRIRQTSASFFKGRAGLIWSSLDKLWQNLPKFRKAMATPAISEPMETRGDFSETRQPHEYSTSKVAVHCRHNAGTIPVQYQCRPEVRKGGSPKRLARSGELAFGRESVPPAPCDAPAQSLEGPERVEHPMLAEIRALEGACGQFVAGFRVLLASDPLRWRPPGTQGLFRAPPPPYRGGECGRRHGQIGRAPRLLCCGPCLALGLRCRY